MPRPNPGPVARPGSWHVSGLWVGLGLVVMVATVGWVWRRRKRRPALESAIAAAVAPLPLPADGAIEAWCQLVRERVGAMIGERGLALTIEELMEEVERRRWLDPEERATLEVVLREGERRVYGPAPVVAPSHWPDRTELTGLLEALGGRGQERAEPAS